MYPLYNGAAWGESVPMNFAGSASVCKVSKKVFWSSALLPSLFFFFAQVGNCQMPVEAVKAPPTAVQSDPAEQTNDRIQQLALSSRARQGDYVIRGGDLLNIEVFEVPELSREVRVNESGFISLPLLPSKVQAAGLTLFQLQDSMAEMLRSNGLVSNPQVTVYVKEMRGEPITVIGAVRNPMVVQALRPMTLLEVLSQVGGIAADAGNEIIISRAPRPVDASGASAGDVQGQSTAITVDLNNLLDTGDSRYNIPLQGGDVVRVPRAGVVYVVGAVQRAGGFVMQNDRQQLTVLKALSLAGGLQPTAKQQAVIMRIDPLSGDRQQLPVDLQKILKLKTDDVSLLQSDILYVPDSAGKRALRRGGEVALSLVSGVALVRATR